MSRSKYGMSFYLDGTYPASLRFFDVGAFEGNNLSTKGCITLRIDSNLNPSF